MTFEELQHIKELNKNAEDFINGSSGKIQLPRDFTETIPREGRMWLYKAGITESMVADYGFGYSDYLGRVVLPVFNEKGDLNWFQCRAIHKEQRPKYIQPARGRDSILFCASQDQDVSTEASVVEDILSAVRVHKATKNSCYSLLGTKAETNNLRFIGRHKAVATWLDPDNAGQKGARTLRKDLGLLCETRNIITEVDPKYLSDQEIRRVLCQK